MRRPVSLPSVGPFLVLVVAAIVTIPTASRTLAQPDKAAAKLYKTHCAECHGSKGRGDGEKAERLGLSPRDFSLGSFKCRCTPPGSLPTDADLERVIRDGMPGSAMTGFGRKLEPEQIRALVAQVKWLAGRFSDEEPACMEIPEVAPSTTESINQGRQVYRLLQCAKCHGPEGRGDGPSAESLVDSWGDDLKVPDFPRRGRLKCGAEEVDLYRTLHSGIAGTPMPSYTEAFLFAADKVPAPSTLESTLGAMVVAEVASYLETQPESVSLVGMTDGERAALIEQRSWALVHYLRWLIESPVE